MEIKVKYFGQIAEITACEEEVMPFNNTSISSLLESLYVKYPNLKYVSFKVAQNQELVELNTMATGQDIALLPPFAGG